MPIYEFKCLSCFSEFEILVLKSDAEVHCESCASTQLQKLISRPTIGKGTAETPCGNSPCSPKPMCGSGNCGG